MGAAAVLMSGSGGWLVLARKLDDLGLATLNMGFGTLGLSSDDLTAMKKTINAHIINL